MPLLIAVLLGLLSSEIASGTVCSDVFPADATESAVAKLDLSVMDSPASQYASFPSKGIGYTGAGDFFYRSGTLANKGKITVTPGRRVRIFVEGDVEFAPHAEVNSGGDAADLLIVVRGNLKIGTKNEIKALVYVTGNVEANPDIYLEGALTAEGTVTTKVKDVIEYDEEAAEEFMSGDLCSPEGESKIDHFHLAFSTPQFSCEPIPVLIRACADASCSSTVAVNKTLALTPANRWLGNGTVTFADTDTATAYLKRIPGTLQLGVAGEPYRCNSGDCGLEILESGFAIRVPALIAGREVAAEVQAMRLDESSGACVADGGFASSERTVALWSAYSAPDSGSRALWIAGGSIGTHAGDASLRTLRFDAQARSGFPIRYDDAGALDLHVRYLGSGAEDGLVMRGSARFVSRPYGFCVQAYRTGCNDPSCLLLESNGDVLRAGASFDLHIKPVQLAASQLPSDLCSAQLTPNFTDELVLHAPFVGPGHSGHPGVLGLKKYSHPVGGSHVLSQELHEVGNFKIKVSAENYENLPPFGSFSEAIGRFVPGYLKAELKEVPKLTPGCGHFSYQDQSISYRSAPELTVTGMSLGDRVTHNYDLDAFWKVPGELKTSLEFADGQKQEAARLDGTGVFKLPTGVSDISGDGSKTYRMEGASVLYRRDLAGPQREDEPFEPELILVVPGAEFKYEESAGVITCHDGLGCPDFKSASFGFENSGGEIRLGRVSVSSAHGVEFEPLELIYRTEIWRDGAFSSETSGCTAFTDVDLREFTGNLEGRTHAQVLSPVLGIGRIRLTAPGEGGAGSVTVIPRVSPELTFNWKGEGFEEPSGLATFGIYKGNDKIIFRREIIGR